ncbi:MAG: phage portal protein [Gammaproteobacteria bacterium]|nr:phage portal protein [Gammaproteobacteria bacterium]
MILSKLFRSFENPATPLSDPANWLLDAFGQKSASGVRVNESAAMQYSAVSACVLVLSESVAQLPLSLHRKAGTKREIASDHPAHRLMRDEPNDDMTSFTFRSTLQGHATTWGNGFAFIVRDADNRASRLIPLLPDRTFVRRVNGQVVYRTVLDGSSVDMGQFEVLHIPGFGFDGLTGYSPIQLQREAIGMGIAGQQFSGKLFSNGGSISGVLTHPNHFKDPDARKAFANAWNNAYTGIDNARKTAVLEDGMEFKPIGMPATDAQLLESRKFSRTEICGWYRVPPHMIGDLEKATFSNIEKQDIFFVKHTLLPWLQRWEQELNRKLLPEGQKDSHFFRFNVDGLLRGDSKSRAEAYQIAINTGYLTRNEVRELEDRDPIDGLDTVLEPLNMAPVGSQGDEEPEDDSGSDDSDDGLRSAAEKLADKALTRAGNRESKAISQRLKRNGLDGWHEWLPEFYEQHAAWMSDVCGFSSEFVRTYVVARLQQVSNQVAESGHFVGFEGKQEWKSEALQTS